MRLIDAKWTNEDNLTPRQNMRLIDGKLLADEILGEIFERGQASGLWEQQLEIGALTYADIEYADGYDSALEHVYRQISDMKTVEAIPIEWMEKWFEEHLRSANDGDDVTVDVMLDDWRKENETD